MFGFVYAKPNIYLSGMIRPHPTKNVNAGGDFRLDTLIPWRESLQAMCPGGKERFGPTSVTFLLDRGFPTEIGCYQAI